MPLLEIKCTSFSTSASDLLTTFLTPPLVQNHIVPPLRRRAHNTNPVKTKLQLPPLSL